MGLRFVRWFREISIEDIPLAGGKNASLGEMVQSLLTYGINIPDGFAITAEAYWETIKQGGALENIRALLIDLDTANIVKLQEVGARVRELIGSLPLPIPLEEE